MDINTKDLLLSGSTNKLLDNAAGLFKTEFLGNQMLYQLPYVQPSAIVSQPAIFDLLTDQTTSGSDFYLFDLRETIMESLNRLILFTAYKVDMASGEIIIGYDNNDGTETGSVIYTNFDNEILTVVPLNYVPREIFIREVN